MGDWYELKVLAAVVLVGLLFVGGLVWFATALDYSYYSYVWVCDTTRIADGWRTSCGWQ